MLNQFGKEKKKGLIQLEEIGVISREKQETLFCKKFCIVKIKKNYLKKLQNF